MTRWLECQECHETVGVMGDVDDIDPARYRCIQCRDPRHQPELPLEGRRVEPTPYNPDQTEIPF